jgi:hypothetical protein
MRDLAIVVFLFEGNIAADQVDALSENSRKTGNK